MLPISQRNPRMKIFIENVGSLQAAPIQSLPLPTGKKGMGKAWENLVVDDMRILAKKPLEHPWLGYPDAQVFQRWKGVGEWRTSNDDSHAGAKVIATPTDRRPCKLTAFYNATLILRLREKMFDFTRGIKKSTFQSSSTSSPPTSQIAYTTRLAKSA